MLSKIKLKSPSDGRIHTFRRNAIRLKRNDRFFAAALIRWCSRCKYKCIYDVCGCKMQIYASSSLIIMHSNQRACWSVYICPSIHIYRTPDWSRALNLDHPPRERGGMIQLWPRNRTRGVWCVRSPHDTGDDEKPFSTLTPNRPGSAHTLGASECWTTTRRSRSIYVRKRIISTWFFWSGKRRLSTWF